MFCGYKPLLLDPQYLSLPPPYWMCKGRPVVSGPLVPTNPALANRHFAAYFKTSIRKG